MELCVGPNVFLCKWPLSWLSLNISGVVFNCDSRLWQPGGGYRMHLENISGFHDR